MIAIWKERIYHYDAISSGQLLRSVQAITLKMDADAYELEFGQEFMPHGIFVDAGTGKEVYKDNPGDIGRDKVRKAKPWYHLKYYMSFRNLLDFVAGSLGQEAVQVIASGLSDEALRKSVY